LLSTMQGFPRTCFIRWCWLRTA